MSGEFGNQKWKFDIYAEKDGTMAILPFGEIKFEIRKSPKGVFKILELAANQAYETNHMNIMGTSINPKIIFTPQTITLKKIREFFTKNQTIKTFLAGMDKKDERIFFSDVKGMVSNPADRVIRRNTRDRALYFVVSGQFFGMDDSYPSNRTTYKTGAVIGVQEFLHDDKWNMDLICHEEGIIARYDHKAFRACKIN